MQFDWTKHRFSGGLLIFDLINTVVYRGDSARRIDRLSDVDTLSGFASAVEHFRADEVDGKIVHAPVGQAQIKVLHNFRETTNEYFRPRIAGGGESHVTLSELFAAAASISNDDLDFSGARISLGQLAAHSAMKLFDTALQSRCKACPNCDWLFVDRSKNCSRLWCDMAVCGNRAKAKEFYRRQVYQSKRGSGT